MGVEGGVGAVDGLEHDGGNAVAETPLVGVDVFRFVADEAAGKPEKLMAGGVEVSHIFIAPVGLAASDDFHFHRCRRGVGNIHVQTYTFGKRIVKHGGNDFVDKREARLEISVRRMVGQGETYSRNTLRTSLESSAHGSGIQCIHRGVGAVVDSRDNDIGTVIATYGIEGEFDAVDRGTVCAPHLCAEIVGMTVQSQRSVDGDGHRLPRAWSVGTNGDDIAEFHKTGDEFMHAEGVDAVVVAYEY